MIYDKWDNRELYRAMFPEVWSMVEKFFEDNHSPEEGKYELDGDKVFVSVSCYNSRDIAESKSEAHQKYIDIQIVLAGEEDIFCSLPGAVDVASADFSGSDCAFFPLEAEKCFPVRMKPGVFAVFFPGEGHAPMVTPAGKTTAKMHKAVVKIAADCLK